MDISNEILDQDFGTINTDRRRKLLPWWMKCFIWFFMLLSASVPFALLMGVQGKGYGLMLYGLKTLDPFSLIGLGLMTIILFKGIASWGLWTEKDWAIKLGQIDAMIGIFVCLFVMLVYPILDPSFSFNFRLEIPALVVFFMRLDKIKNEWKIRGASKYDSVT